MRDAFDDYLRDREAERASTWRALLRTITKFSLTFAALAGAARLGAQLPNLLAP